ncbi:head maturation protease, ClpP-related [Streptomyces sp. NPDC127168]|uniref:head maturation protease, ClpP-related n=1 Tax=unclassified Streptomyces TaxID=2593676 RepID=UPI003634983E
MNITLPGKAATLMASQREQAEKQRARLGVEARSWYRISNAADPDEAEVMIYDEVGGWFGCTADDLIAELKQVTAPRMRVRINSPGGSVFEGIAIANALRAHPATVTVQVDAIAASIASVIAMAGDRIEMAPNSMLMIHDASGLCWGNAADMDEMSELLDLISDNIADSYAARAGGTREQWRERMRAETWYLPEDAVDNGLADEAVAAPKAGTSAEPEPDMARAWDLSAYGYTGPRATEEPLDVTEHVAGPPTLVISVADLLDEDTVARLRAAVAPPAEPVAETTPVEPAPAPAVPEPEAPAAEPENEWTTLVAHLTHDDADTWSALVSTLTEPDTSSRAAADA